MTEREIFTAALGKANPALRAAFLDDACAGDAALRQRVESLLAEHEQLGSFMEVSSPEATLDRQASERPGTQIGPYKLLQQIGEGGMGVVYMAEQKEPVERRVALKIIKPGMDTRQVIARFEAERQALAMMDHPNIAKVLDAGTTQGVGGRESGIGDEYGQPTATPDSRLLTPGSGRPYFIMELVKGVPITQFCDERRLSLRERLALVVPVCQAIQHAHQKGIIHRDIKPTNILVTLYDGRPVPKVIDFGVAKAMGPKLTEKTMFTALGQLVGTLEYMSPEQAQLNQLDIDTRSDIYSLGVLLYELLTGSTPFEQSRLRTLAFDETLRIIREEEPLRPSTRLSSSLSLPTIAANRGSEPGRLQKAVRGELDWIVMKCLEKDRNRRYETAGSLALDLARYLTDEPVQACPPSAWYRLGKFARKYRVALMMAAVVALMTLMAVGSIGWILRDAAAQQVARQAAADRDLVRALDTVEALYQQERFPAAQIALKEAERSASRGDVSEPLSRLVQRWKADLAIVAQLDEIEVELMEQTFYGAVEAQGERWDERYRLAFAQYGLDFEKLPVAEAVRRIRASSVHKELLFSLDRWAVRCGALQTPHAERLIAVVRQADPNPWHQKIRDAYWRRDFKTLEELAKDEELLRQPSAMLLLSNVLPPKTFIPGRPHAREELLLKLSSRKPDDFRTHLGLANLYAGGPGGGWPEAVERYRMALLARPHSAAVHRQFGMVLGKLNRGVESDAEFQEAIRLRPELLANYTTWLRALQWQKRWADAEAPARELVRRDPRDLVIRMNLGDVLFELSRIEEAEAVYEQARAMRPDLAPPRIRLADNYARWGAWEKAAAIYRQLIQDDSLTATQEYRGAVLLHFLGDLDTARKFRAESVSSAEPPASPLAAALAAKVCLLLPQGDEDTEAFLKVAPRNTLALRWDITLIRGLSRYRRGQLEAAMDWLQSRPPLTVHSGAVTASIRAPNDAALFVVLAMVKLRLNQRPEAEEYLKNARRVMQVSLPDPAKGNRLGENDWSEWLVCQILLREAEELLEGTTPAATANEASLPAETTPQTSRK